MCLAIRMTKKELAEYKRTLPKEFPVWKTVRRGGWSEYCNCGNEPEFNQVKTYKAGSFPRCRAALDYKPGFHVFITQCGANSACCLCYLRVVEFWARREWITQAGHFNTSYRRVKGLVLSHIEVRELPRKQIEKNNG